MNKQRVLELLCEAIATILCESGVSLEVVRDWLEMTQEEFDYVFNYYNELEAKRKLSQNLMGAEFITEEDN